MENFLKETIHALKSNGKEPKDVLWVGSLDGKYADTWDRFSKLADFEYYNYPDSSCVSLQLAIVGDGWWLERHEHAACQCWKYKSCPVKKVGTAPLTVVNVKIWDAVNE